MRLELPFPISKNALRGYGRGNVFHSKEYKAWIAEADGMFLQQKKSCGEPILDHFKYHIALDWSRRTTANDGQNYTECVLDFLQRVKLIENDKFADGGTWDWAPISGCVVQVHRSLIQTRAA